MTRMTDRFVASAKCREGGRQTDFHDDQITGLMLRVYATGRKAWVLKYTRPTTGKRTKINIGRYPEMPLARARVRATERKGEIADGKDPAAEKRAHKSAMRISDLVDIYIARHASDLRSGKAIERRLRKNIVALIGDIKLADLHRRDIRRAIDEIVDRGAATEANRVFEDIRAMIRWAVSGGYLDSSPVEAMKRPAKTTSRERVLSTDEIKQLWTRLPDAPMSEPTRNIMRLCLITGQRVGEVCGMRHDELDLARQLWSLPGARTKNGQAHNIALSTMALEVILEASEAADGASFLFPSPSGNKPIAGHAIATAVRRSQGTIGFEHWTTHDLRRTVASGMAEMGISPFIIGHVLNHVSTTRATITTAIYARYSYDKEKREALDAWSARLAGIIGQQASVVPLRRA